MHLLQEEGMTLTPATLTAEEVGAYLAGRGLISMAAPITVSSLGGGISNVVLAASAGPVDVVVKQSLPRLRVEDEWLAKRERVLTEAAALRLLGSLTPANVPEVLDIDPDRFAVTIARAPRSWVDWKALLLAGDADPAVAATLGEVLGTWHAGTWGREEVRRAFDDLEAFEQLRVDPYYRTVMRRRPDLAAAIGRRIERMQVCRTCLVHGDFSPKNVLVPASTASVPADGDRPLWVVDAEVAHFGDPAFDTGFMLNHLMLKAIRRPDRREAYRACALAFWTSYEESGASRAEEPDTLGHLACLMLSRVHGKSRAEYLDEAGRAAAGRLGQNLLFHTPSTLEAAWERLAVGAA